MKKLAVVLILFLSISLVSAFGATIPYPSYRNLYPGESGSFFFQVQLSSNSSCEFSSLDETPIELTLPENQILNITPSPYHNFYIQSYVPLNTPSESYTERFCVKCCPVEGNVCGKICLPVTVNVLAPSDDDNDGTPNHEDKCPSTTSEALVYGCSCEQILELKPGANTLENKQGCSKGILEVFTKTIGWAKELL